MTRRRAARLAARVVVTLAATVVLVGAGVASCGGAASRDPATPAGVP